MAETPEERYQAEVDRAKRTTDAEIAEAYLKRFSETYRANLTRRPVPDDSQPTRAEVSAADVASEAVERVASDVAEAVAECEAEAAAPDSAVVTAVWTKHLRALLSDHKARGEEIERLRGEAVTASICIDKLARERDAALAALTAKEDADHG